MNLEGLYSYYSQLFPVELICKFLTNNYKYPLIQKEFAFSAHFKRYETFKDLKSSKEFTKNYPLYLTQDLGLKVPIRFQNHEELKDYLIKNLPNTINVGPIFPPHVSRSDPFAIFPKPLFFDIDMEDYTNETSTNRPSHIPPAKRTCTCTTTCDACWILILRDPLVACMDFLKGFMEFTCVIPVYSGRRGFHIWVMDEWELDKESREYIVNKMPAILDRNVTIQSTHLMKLFLVPHKTTGRLAIPILDVETFVPSMAVDIDKDKMEEFKSFLLHSF